MHGILAKSDTQSPENTHLISSKMSSGKQNTRGVAGKDSFQRINYLYQLATMMSKQQNPKLSSYYGRMSRLVGQKSVLRVEPEMKRKICKTCRNILIPGTTAELTVTGNDNVCEIKCDNCAATKIFQVNPQYKMWLDDPQSVVEVITINPRTNTGQSTPPVPASETCSTEAPESKEGKLVSIKNQHDRVHRTK